MIDINRIIKTVKRGSVFRSSFNLKRSYIEPGEKPSDPAVSPTIPVKPEVEDTQLITPTVPSIPAEISPPEITEREEQILDNWVGKNINVLIGLVGHGEEVEIKNYIEPSFILPGLIKDNSNVYGILSKKIRHRSKNQIDERDANLFVDTILEISGDYQKNIDEAASKERESISNLEIILEEKIMNIIKNQYTGSLEEGVSAFLRNIGVKNFDPKKEQVVALLNGGIKNRFGIPGLTPAKQEAGRDQRLNFFVNNPVHLQPFLENHPELGIKYNASKNDNEKLAVLADFNNNNNSILFQELGKLINELDMSVMKWIAKGSNAILKSRTKAKMPENEEKELSPLDNEDNTATSDIGKGLEGEPLEQQIKKEESNETLMLGISTAAQEYIEEDINRMKELNQLTSQTIMEEYTQRLQQEEKTLNSADKNIIISSYSKGEKLNAFFKYVSEQLEKTYLDKGKLLNSGSRKIVYLNKGKAIVPSDILNKVFNNGMKMSPEQLLENIPKSKEYIEKYKQRVRAGEKESLFTPDWREMCSYKIVLDAFGDLGEIKSRIFDLQKGGTTDPKGVIAKLSMGRDSELLKTFSNVEGIKDPKGNLIPTEPDNIVQKKIYDFVYMTLQQGVKNKNRANKTKPFIVDVAKPMSIYEKKFKKEKELEAASKIKDEVKRNIVEKEIKSTYLRNANNLKAEIGSAYIPLLPYIERNLSQFSTESVVAFVDLFDHHRMKLRNFFDLGQIENNYDPQKRTNTELYYKIRGEVPPKNVQIMIDVYNDHKRSKTQGAISGEDWRVKVLELWGAIDQNDRALKIQAPNVGKARRKRDERIRNANFKVLKYYEGNNNVDVLKNIKDPLKRSEFEQYMKYTWDKVSKLPIKYYSYFKGLAMAEKIIGDKEANLKAEQAKLTDIMKEVNLKKMEINNILGRNGVEKIASSAMKIVFAQYQIVKKKLLKLSKMKQYSYKFASMDTILIEESIIKIKTDFYKLFDRLLR